MPGPAAQATIPGLAFAATGDLVGEVGHQDAAVCRPRRCPPDGRPHVVDMDARPQVGAAADDERVPPSGRGSRSGVDTVLLLSPTRYITSKPGPTRSPGWDDGQCTVAEQGVGAGVDRARGRRGPSVATSAGGPGHRAGRSPDPSPGEMRHSASRSSTHGPAGVDHPAAASAAVVLAFGAGRRRRHRPGPPPPPRRSRPGIGGDPSGSAAAASATEQDRSSWGGDSLAGKDGAL